MGEELRDKNSYTAVDDIPFYSPSFEQGFRFIIDEYTISPREIAIFIPCALKKPYSSSPSHRLFKKVILSVLSPPQFHAVIFGTCGVVPAELEMMYPYAHYQYMLGKCVDQRIKRDFLEVETSRLAAYLVKTKGTYRKRIAYCIGIFREAMAQACDRTGIALDILLPSRPMIERMWSDDCPFPEGSLSMKEYLDEFQNALRMLLEEDEDRNTDNQGEMRNSRNSVHDHPLITSSETQDTP